jgi:hypothetical protein
MSISSMAMLFTFTGSNQALSIESQLDSPSGGGTGHLPCPQVVSNTDKARQGDTVANQEPGTDLPPKK